MESYFLLWLTVIVIGTIISYFIVKNVLKVVVTFLFIAALFVAITISLTYSDIQDLKQELGKEQILYLLHTDTTLLFPVVMINMTDKHVLKQPDLSEDKLASWLRQENYRVILDQGVYYKLVLVNSSAYGTADASLLSTLANTQSTFAVRQTAFETLHKDKSMILFLFQGYKSGDVTVYPKTMFFRIIKIVPENWVAALVDEEQD